MPDGLRKRLRVTRQIVREKRCSVACPRWRSNTAATLRTSMRPAGSTMSRSRESDQAVVGHRREVREFVPERRTELDAVGALDLGEIQHAAAHDVHDDVAAQAVVGAEAYAAHDSEPAAVDARRVAFEIARVLRVHIADLADRQTTRLCRSRSQFACVL